nr:MAG TPA: hypothetical protein [Caudoviricetes sp.]
MNSGSVIARCPRQRHDSPRSDLGLAPLGAGRKGPGPTRRPGIVPRQD